MVLNPWDVQSKHVHTTDGVSSALCNGEKRWGGLPPIVLAVFEGNGCRPSHQGFGLSTDGKTMYTLNSTEVHGVAYELPKNDRPTNGE